MRLNRSLFSALVAGLVLAACQTTPISELSPEQGIERIRSNHAEGNWEIMIQDVNEYRARHPYSPFATEALLLQADANFQSRRYPEAIVLYDEFLQKTASHPQRALAAFRIAKSYDVQSSEEVDREQDYTRKAVERYASYLEAFPNGTDAADVKGRIAELRRRLAEHDLFVARFYWRKEIFHAALSRYLEILEKHTQYADIRSEAAARASEAYEMLARELEKDPKSDKVIFFRSSTPAELRAKSKEIVAKGSAPKP